MGDRDEVFCLLVGLPWISVVTSGVLALLLATIAFNPLTPHEIPHSMVRPWGYPMCATVGQEARSMDSALRLGTLVTFCPQEVPTRGFPLHLYRPVNRSLLVEMAMPQRKEFKEISPGRKVPKT